MFANIKKFFTQLFTDFQSTFTWIFIFGIIFCAIMVGWGGDENAPKFKKGLITCIFGLVIFLSAKLIVEYVNKYV
uniref:Uncharacterized protein n=1 Tax=Aeromonas sp. Ne-1 TaxID=1675689 RepID=A0A0H4J9M0_9GAMM|nr:hypothetical protein [Aeromonas sp. Ne-1]AKO69698.1 hypothetical protein [Aeromonas sp. Ne-1]